MFYRLDLLVTPHPKALGLAATYWTPEPERSEGARHDRPTSVAPARPARPRRPRG